jgi:hypothetical protein
MLTETGAAVIVAVTEVDLVVSATEVAVIDTLGLPVGSVLGAAYVVDVLVTVVSLPSPLVGEILHMTPLLVRS